MGVGRFRVCAGRPRPAQPQDRTTRIRLSRNGCWKQRFGSNQNRLCRPFHSKPNPIRALNGGDHMRVELKVPSVGESISEVEIGEWKKAPGQRVQKDEPLVVLESEKATVDFPSPQAGVLTEQLKSKGQTARIGEIIGYLDESAPEAAPSSSSSTSAQTAPANAPP